MSVAEIALIDLSSIAYPIWHTSQSEPDPNRTSQLIVERVRILAANHPHAAVCCDSGQSFRRELSPAYKANRPERDASLHHQIDLAKEQLIADGFPVWGVRSFEADDLIATGTARALVEDLAVLIISSDKDLLQLVGDRVRAMSATNGAIFDAAAVMAKFGVTPAKMRDYLVLVGDASDNIKGAPGIGPKIAAGLLGRYDTIEAIYADLAANPTAFKPAVSTALHTFRPSLETTRALVTMRADVPIPFEELAAERTPKDTMNLSEVDEDQPSEDPEESPAPLAPSPAGSAAPSLPPVPNGEARDNPSPSVALAVREPDAIVPAPAEWERQLDPRSMRDAQRLAEDMHKSRMFSAYGSAAAVLSTVMVGREIGLPAMASLRSIHNIEGRHSLSASLMVALVLKSGLAEYFEPIGFSETEATFETKRKGARNPVRLTHTIEMGRQAWPKSKADWERAFLASGWGRNPTDLLVARAQSRLARMIYPDLLAGLYTPEELAEIREAA